MDKYEYKLKLEQMKTLTCEHDYKTAAAIADMINWRKVRSVSSLCMVAEIYEHVNRMEDSRDMLLLAYDRSPIGKMIIYRLAMLAIRMNSLEEAEEYYQEFLDIAPHDNFKYIIRYRLHQAQDKDISLQIQDLEDLKEQEYTEEWAYELAELYGKAHLIDQCIKECDELVLWFGEGEYVEKALKLKMRYQPLSHEQAQMLRQMHPLDEPQADEQSEEVATENVEEVFEPENDFAAEFAPVEELNAHPMQVAAARSLHIPLPGSEEESLEIREVDDDVLQRESLKEGITENFKQIMEAAEAEEKIKRTYTTPDSAIASVRPPDGAPQTEVYDRLQDVLDEWEKTRQETAKTFKEAEEKRLQAAKVKAIHEAEDTMDQLAGIIPEEEVERLRQKLQDTKNLTSEEVCALVAEMTQILQQEIDAISEQEEALDAFETEVEASNAYEPEENEELSDSDESERAAEVSDFDDVENEPDESDADEEEEQPDEEMAEQSEATSELLEEMESETKTESSLTQDMEVAEAQLKEVVTELEKEAEDTVQETVEEESADVSSAEQQMEPEEETVIPKLKIPPIEIPNLQLNIEVPKPILPPRDTVASLEKPVLNPQEEQELQRAEEELQEELEAADMQSEEQELQRVEEELQEELEAADEEILEEPTQRMPDLSGILHKMRTSFSAVRDRFQEQEDIYQPEPVMMQTEMAEEMMPELEKSPADTPKEDGDISQADAEVTSEWSEEGDALSEEEQNRTIQARNMAKRQEELEHPIEENSESYDSDTQEMRRLPTELRRIFSYFVPVTGMEQQLCRILQGICDNRQNSESSRMGNVLIQGARGSGKTVLAANLIKALQKLEGGTKRQVGKIEAQALNQKDLNNIIQKVSGGYLIIELAGELTKETAITLSLLMEGNTQGLVIILEDTRAGIRKALSLDASFAAKFTERIDIPLFTSDELVAFGRTYAKDRGYRIDEMGVLALYNRISSIQKRDQATTLAEIKEIVDKAIVQSEKGGIKKILGMFSNRKETEDEYLPLREKDFEVEDE